MIKYVNRMDLPVNGQSGYCFYHSYRSGQRQTVGNRMGKIRLAIGDALLRTNQNSRNLLIKAAFAGTVYKIIAAFFILHFPLSEL